MLWNRFDDADAMLVLPVPPDALDENRQPIPEKTRALKPERAMLVTGKLAHDLRDPANRRKLNAVVHPYRFIPRNAKAQAARQAQYVPDAAVSAQ